MLLAIGIYTVRTENVPNPNTLQFFAPKIAVLRFELLKQVGESLETFEREKLDEITNKMEPIHYYHTMVGIQHCFARMSADQKFVQVLLSKTDISATELHEIFLNVNAAMTHPRFADEKLQDILKQPLKYISQKTRSNDPHVEKVQKQLDELKDTLKIVMEKIIERGEKIEDVYQRTLKLDTTAIEFRDEAKKKRSCCG